MATFRIDLEGVAGQRDTLLYCTDPASLRHLEGGPVDLLPLAKQYVGNAWKERPSFSPAAPIGKSRCVRRLKIQLGLGCNQHCSYCSQKSQIASATAPADVEPFLVGMDAWLEGEPEKIELWGGEPLLYWKKIETLAPALRQRFPAAKLLIITNGTLLTKARTAFIKQHQITVGVSHDGPGQALRGYDPFASKLQSRELLRLFDAIGLNASFNAVITAQNTDIKAVVDYFTAKMGRQVIVNVEDPVSAYEGGTNTRFTAAQFARLHEDVTRRILDGTALDVPSVLMKLEAFFNGIAGGIRQDQCGQWCNMDAADFLAVDLAGNVLTCQNVGALDHKIGNLKDFDGIKLDTSHHFSTRPHCAGCPVVHLCYGSCMFLSGREFDVSCDNSYHYNLAVIFAAIELLTRKKVVGIDYRKPRRVIPIASMA